MRIINAVKSEREKRADKLAAIAKKIALKITSRKVVTKLAKEEIKKLKIQTTRIEKEFIIGEVYDILSYD